MQTNPAVKQSKSLDGPRVCGITIYAYAPQSMSLSWSLPWNSWPLLWCCKPCHWPRISKHVSLRMLYILMGLYCIQWNYLFM